MEETYRPFLGLGVALGVGLLIGLEREQKAANEPAQKGTARLGGARTFPLIALSGAISIMLGPWVVGLMLAGLLIICIIALADALKRELDTGITSEVAMVMTFLIGALAQTEDVFGTQERTLLICSALGVITMTLLSYKTPLHDFVKKVSRDDIYATVKLLLVAVIVLPLLPDKKMGPLDAFNPYNTGLMVVLIAGIGFVGYIAVRFLGPGRGLGVTGLVGGLASSTAVTLSMASRAKEEPAAAGACTMAILLASTVMLFRVMVTVAIVFEPLLPRLAIYLGAMAAGGLIASALFYLRSRKEAPKSGEMKIENPFQLRSALKFGALFALVLLAAKAAHHYFGQSGSYLAGLISGTTDVDAITISMSKMAKEGLDAKVAITTILIASMSNTVVKAAMAISIGGWAFGKKSLLGFLAMLLGGGLGLGALWVSW